MGISRYRNVLITYPFCVSHCSFTRTTSGDGIGYHHSFCHLRISLTRMRRETLTTNVTGWSDMGTSRLSYSWSSTFFTIAPCCGGLSLFCDLALQPGHTFQFTSFRVYKKESPIMGKSSYFCKGFRVFSLGQGPGVCTFVHSRSLQLCSPLRNSLLSLSPI